MSMLVFRDMEIVYLGHSSFRIRGRSLGEWVTIVTDPYSQKTALTKFPKITSVSIITISHDHADHNDFKAVKSDEIKPKVLIGPGEYEVKGVIIHGVATYHDSRSGEERGENTVFVFDFEGIKLVHLGDLGHKLSEAQLGEIGNVDVLFIPVGGVSTIDPQIASEVISQLEPSIVVPMHYKAEGLGGEQSLLSDVSEFEKVMGVEAKRQDKLELKGVPQEEEMQVIVLEAKR